MSEKFGQPPVEPVGVMTHMPAWATPDPASVMCAVKVTVLPGLAVLGDELRETTVGGVESVCAIAGMRGPSATTIARSTGRSQNDQECGTRLPHPIRP